MNGVSLNQFYCLRVSCSAISIVAGCIILGVSSYCGADAVGGIFLGAGALGLTISIFPFIRTWMEYNRVLPFLGNMRVHPQQTNNNPELASVSYAREG
ncbi:kinocilin [Hypanus sabinus]|uniref:kinocilin n=1 Tax=Hypanus sabinus TaxID=79690 RepID=UPI0028C3F278|nr:kinocilin [Hypanus sabinus]